MRSIRRPATLLATAVLAIGLAACGSGGGASSAPGAGPQISSGGDYNPQPRDNVKDGGTLTDSFPEISSQFNQFQGDSTLYSRLAWNWYNPMVITFEPAGKALFNQDYLVGEPKVETVGGKTQVTYTINPKAVYNDGTPIDWHSYEATWKANSGKDPAYSVNSSDGYDRIESVTQGADAKQAVITFDGVYVWYTSLFNYLLNPEALAPDTFNKAYLNNPHAEWGAGPYTISKYDQQNGSLTFERNPKWWGNPGKLDSHIILALEPTARINAFKNGQLDVVYAPTAELLNQVKSMPNTQVRRSTAPSVYILQLNSKSPALTDPALRKAIMEGVDRAQVAKVQFQGLDYTEALPGSINVLPFQDGYQDNFSKAITFDVNKAKADLDAAGYVAGPDGTRSKNGQPTKFTFVYNGASATAKAIAASLGQMMKNIGVTMDVRQLASSEFSSVIAGRSFDVFFNGFSSSDPNPAYFCQLYCSNSTLNLSGSGTPDLDAQIKAAAALPTAAEQVAKANEVEVEAQQTYGIMPMYNGPPTSVMKSGLANYGSFYGGTSLFYNALPQDVGFQK